MSSIGSDPVDYTPGNQPDGSYYNLFPTSSQPGLLGGQFASQQASAPAGMAGVSPDIGGDGTGLSPSLYLPQLQDPASMTSDDTPQVDASFIAGQEGQQRAIPYPVGSAEQFPNAGITVATGVDLGAHNAAKLKRWGVSDAAIAVLKPYLQLKGQAALNALNDPKNNPLPTIGQADLDAMDRGALNDTVGAVQNAYDATNPATSFSDLTHGQQTAIVDLAYQFGTNLGAAAPKFWGAVTSGDWDGAMNELNHFYGPKITPSRHDIDRRQAEAGLIKGGGPGR